MNRATFFDLIPPMPQDQRQQIQWAYRLAKAAHEDQSRDDGQRYFEHVRRVALLLIEFGYGEFTFIILALLHDTLEDTFTPVSMLEQLFGPAVARYVLTVSKSYCLEDPLTGTLTRTAKRDSKEYFEGIRRNGRLPAIAKCVDRIDNLSDLVDPPEGSRWTPEKCLRQVAETREWILPLAEMFDPRIADRLSRDCGIIEAAAKKKIATALRAIPTGSPVGFSIRGTASPQRSCHSCYGGSASPHSSSPPHMPRYGNASQRSVRRAVRKMKKGTLKSGRSKRKVTSRKQAIAIGLSEARKRGAKVPRRPRSGARKK